MRALQGLLGLWLLLFLRLVAAQGSNVITVPQGGFNVTAGESFTLEWTDPSQDSVTIQLMPTSGDPVTLGTTLPNNGQATLDIPSDLSTTQPYRFKIMDDSNSSNSHTSPSFDVSPGESNRTTSASSPTSTATTSRSSHRPRRPLSSAAIAGLSVGVVLVVALLVGVVILILWHRHRQRKPSADQQRDEEEEWRRCQQNRQQRSYAQQGYHQSGVAELYHDGDAPFYLQRTEVPGDKRYPREVEGMSRFPHTIIAELPASAPDEDGKAR